MEALQKKEITRTMTISDVVLLYPEVIPILLDNGVHCVGCNVSAYETVEDGFKSHGMNEEEINKVISKLNSKVSSKPRQQFSVSKSAEDKLKSMLSKFDKSYGLKLSVMRGGCAGFTYGMDIGKKDEKSIVVESGDARIFIDKESYALLEGSQLEYIDSLQGAGFRVSNPNMKEGSGCACGNSFAMN